MKFLVSIVVLLVTSVLILHEPQAPTVEKDMELPAYTAENMESAEADAEYDEIIEASGMLNRLDLFDF